MLENFQLAAIVKQGSETHLLQIPLHQTLQDSLAQSWQSQYSAFVVGVREIGFDVGYQPEQHECFCVKDYEPPKWLIGQDSQSVSELDGITNDDAWLDSTAGVVAFAHNQRGEEVMLFQNFSRSHVIRPGRFLLLEANTYTSRQRAGLTLDSKLSAVFLPTEGKLLFQNFRTVNTFLPLADFFEEASEQEIREILEHVLLAPENADTIATGANQWFRKRFAMLRASGLLDHYSAQQIAEHSKDYEVDIHLKGDQIIFPADRGQAKRLLQFLNEEIYRGAITDTLYETNSKREAD